MSSLPPAQRQRLQPTRDDSFPRADRTRTLSAEIVGDVADREEQSDPIMAAFHDRYQLFERSINALFRSDHPCCAASELDIASLEFAEHDMTDDAPAAAAEPPKPAAPVRVEDDDYDFDEDEDEAPAKKPATPPPLPKRLSSSQVTSTGSPTRPGIDAKDIVATREKLEADRKAAEEAAKRAFHTTFFTLETDRDAMLEQQKLDESDRQVNAEANAAQDTQPGKLSSANLGASSLTLKHLIARIDATRERVKISDMELRNLMSEVRKNRSKWASEEKVGQEELYEAAEKVVLELRAMTEHSTAFLNRVNKREAPDYYTIIKQPMDLGTVMKKLKQHQYKSKKEFVEDINLIWANCLKYNADPNHFLRKHAKAMQKITATLEPLIPDIVIRDRAEVEAEEAGAAEVDAEGESDDEPIMSSRGRKGPGTKKSRKGASLPREGTPDIKPPIVNLIRADSNPPPNDTHMSQNGFLTPTGGTPMPNGISGISQLDLDHDKLADDSKDPEYQAWKKITKKGRAKIASERHKLVRGNKINPEEPALIRSRIGMARHIKNAESHLKDIEEDDLVGTLFGDAEEEDGILLPDYYYPQACVPEIPWRTVWANDGDEEEVEMPDERVRIAPRGMFVPSKSILASKIDGNIKQIQETRKLCAKIGVVKQMQVQTQMYANQFTKYNPKEFVEKDVDDFVISDDGPVMCANVARAALQRSIGKVFYHAGFEEFQPTAIDAITDIAVDYFQKLGKTLMVYQEAPQHERRFDTEETILHTLCHNGADVECLDNYIRDDVDRLGTKLNSIHERMKCHLADLLRPALADSTGDDANFVDGSEQFIGGDFASDIGDDFFGFKELGLDKEFSLSTLSVPLHLLQGRMNKAYQPIQIPGATADEGHKPPPSFEPVTHELLKPQIDLVRNFFLAKLHANNEQPLIEDEDLPLKQRPPKPRLPPTGKISMPRKRPLNGQGGGSKKKKKPNAAPPPVKKEFMERSASKISEADDGNGGMMSPESLVAAG
ncbi:hypothetical protein BZA05DRAFT_442925 [Tricharina praecox]|uniref:uncharacterized protein n=1 Tax=Tricharina praecox TaxID=43433 RepID=UPI00221ED1B9|nr:uncharacterized protein BZA05DRAFT_442925 [Tricharina praecox]KAI5855254.1 hypothetical protein BZA05DRAFT_442925 [Tricharina praecox]